LRAQIISIGQAVIREIDQNITGKLDVDFLIDINTQMIEGLAALPETTTAAAGLPTQLPTV
jgi:flagellar biosynthesis activator protein FlaF